MRAEQFLDMYRDLEEELALRYHPASRRYGSLIMEYINDKGNNRYREEMNTCREIRNLLTHHAEIKGVPIVEPSEEIVVLLSEILAFIRTPPLAVKRATPFSKLLVAHPDQKAFTVMQQMKIRGFSHLPIIDGEKFTGVFSVSTPFAYLLAQPGQIARDFTIGDFGEHTKIEHHCTERFLFAPKDLTVTAAAKEFETVGHQKKRLAMIFLTEHGRISEKIIGVLTPFDILGSGKEQ